MQSLKCLLSCILFTMFQVFAFSQQPNQLNRADIENPYQQTLLSNFTPLNQSANVPAYLMARPNTIWNESFNTLTLPAGWQNQQLSGTGLWTFLSNGTYPNCSPHSGAGMASFQSYVYSSGCIASLVSASFSLTAGQGRLGFWMMRDAGYASSADRVDFMINTSPSATGAALLGTINRCKSLTPVETGADGWYYYEFIIPASFNTASNYILLKATSAYGNNIYIDDIGVSTLLANDVGVVSIDFPRSCVVPGTYTPKITVRNFGSVTQTFPVTLTITSAGYTSTVTAANIAPDSTLQLSFAAWAAEVGYYYVKAVTNLSSDQNRINDTMLINTGVSYSGWQPGTPISTGSYLGSTVLYKRSDTSWIICTGGINNLTMNRAYNTITDSWSTGANLPTGNLQHSSAILKDTLYIIGGYGTSSAPTTLFLKYNLRTNTWSPGTALPAPIGWHKSVSYQDSLIYNVGGYDGTNVLSNVSLYNSNTNSWRQCSALPVGSIGGALARIGDTLIYIGGATLSATVASTYVGIISQTDRSVISWSAKSQYPGGSMYRFDASAWRPGYIIVGGGSPGTAWTPASPNPCYVYRPGNDTWRQMNDLPDPVLGAYTCAFSYGSYYKFALISGYNGSTAITQNQILMDPGFVGIENNGVLIPEIYSLSQNYPNPFNPSTKIDFALPKSGNVTMKVYNVLGKEVATLVNETKAAGSFTVTFDASTLPSGMYFYKIEANGFSEVKKMMLVK